METAEIVGVGSELICGETLDTNTAEVAQSLRPYALEVWRTLRVADDVDRLAQTARELWPGARLLVFLGGLGPTPDDVTTEAVARGLGLELAEDPAMVRTIEERFDRLGRTMTRINLKQAVKPRAAAWLPNPRGTAPGWWLRSGGRDLVVLPGPPAEWRPMWTGLLPRLGLPESGTVRRELKTFGLGESQIMERLADLWDAGVTSGIYAHADGVHLSAEGAAEAVERWLGQAAARLEGYVWGREGDTLPGQVLKRLRAEEAHLATMESLTGGLLAALLTEVPGASRNYLGGVVSYSMGAKARFGVPTDTLTAHGAVSAETASAMAEAARRELNATYGLATTGVAGPDELEGHPVGTVYVGLAGPDGTQTKRYRFPPLGREAVRLRAAYAALALFWSHRR
ncbi:CinA family nicotinamide mononucleotide deamidase-related protein [Oceanithermus desulfurans]|uniref:CinA-like protein n=2 Tax=Oceanithermus desulfurans TaxID=227924 RepID=A0A511RHG0_9DEIN|nr:CinA family nicotinamide mononucleotide deamidase-related protein [Oceanithermus desulfurans]MBB6029284.1 nicotinamide-nucleotide amidase [Oceanithermus desulfurans]GEM89078.1 CinA-like protein [Oceanithermus desulfurans NBRC 100063]